MDLIKGVIVLVISNLPRALHSSDFEITRSITPWIVLHPIQLLLQNIGRIVDQSSHFVFQTLTTRIRFITSKTMLLHLELFS